MIYTTMKNDLKIAMLSKDTAKVSVIRYILGEFKRLKGTKDGGPSLIGDIPTDEQAIKVIKRTIEQENKVSELSGKCDLAFIEILTSYLPKEVDRDTIISWTNRNIDFNNLKNKMQAISIIKNHFGPAANGKLVREIIESINN